MSLHIQIITPEKIILDTQADEIILPTVNGEITVLPQHVPLLTQLAPGELTIKNNSNLEHLVIVGGFLEISMNKVTILAEYAVHGRDISAVKAQEAKERAEKLLKEKLSEKNFVLAQADLRKAILELKVARKMKRVQ